MKSNLKFSLQLISILIMLLLAMPGIARDRLEKITSDSELEYFAQTYYLHPQPELVSQAIEYISSSHLLSKQDCPMFQIAAFFSNIFANNATLVSYWKKIIDKQDAQTQLLLSKAINNSPDQIANQATDDAVRNDIFWGAFFASGDISYLNKIIDQLKYLDERKNLDRFLSAATAKWSLSSNAQRHLAVRATLEAYKRGGDRKMSLMADEILTKSPAQIQDEAKAIVIKQNENGGWQK